ncbi:alpha/beta hydrolase, partial [Cribrihabitans sp. XS_ASV171]
EEAQRGMAAAVDDLNAFLDALMVDEDVLPEQVVLFGFSQGTMMSLHVAPRREEPVAGIVAFSGRLLEPELLKDEVVSRMPVLLVHGDADEMVPPQSLPQAAEALQEAGFKEVYA